MRTVSIIRSVFEEADAVLFMMLYYRSPYVFLSSEMANCKSVENNKAYPLIAFYNLRKRGFGKMLIFRFHVSKLSDISTDWCLGRADKQVIFCLLRPERTTVRGVRRTWIHENLKISLPKPLYVNS